MERISRQVCTEVGSIAATCKAPRTGKEVKEWGILHTVTKAIALGGAVPDARRRHADPGRSWNWSAADSSSVGGSPTWIAGPPKVF
jgi:DUF917 family protein